MASLSDWLGISTLVCAALAYVLGAYWQGKKPKDDEPAREWPQVVVIDGEVRAILAQIREAIHALGRKLDDSTEAAIEHRRATEDNTAELGRRRRDDK